VLVPWLVDVGAVVRRAAKRLAKKSAGVSVAVAVWQTRSGVPNLPNLLELIVIVLIIGIIVFPHVARGAYQSKPTKNESPNARD
jgi:hypothetical protein